jgi:hypothetical protein
MVLDGFPSIYKQLRKVSMYDGSLKKYNTPKIRQIKAHTSSIAHILHQGLPDAHFIFYREPKLGSRLLEICSKHGVSYDAYVDSLLKDTEHKVNYEFYKEWLFEELKEYKKLIMHAVDQKATCINISRGFDIHAKILQDYDRQTLLRSLKRDNILEPWLEALDYAKSKEIPVFMSAGNSGMDAYLDPLKAIKHDAVILVGSTDEMSGTLHSISAMLPQDCPVDICASGRGDLHALGTTLKKKWGLRRQVVVYKNPPGTSIASPDAASLYGMVQCARQKNGFPRLTIEEFRKLLSEGAKMIRKAETPQVKRHEIYGEMLQKLEAQKPKVIDTLTTWQRYWAKQQDLIDYVYSGSESINRQLERNYPEFQKWSQDILNRKEAEITALRAGNGTISGRRRKIVNMALGDLT